MVFHRRYDGQFYRGGDLLQQYPDYPRITIDGNVFVRCDYTGRAHDDITSMLLWRARDRSDGRVSAFSTARRHRGALPHICQPFHRNV